MRFIENAPRLQAGGGLQERMKGRMRTLAKRLNKAEEDLRFKAWIQFQRVLEGPTLEEVERIQRRYVVPQEDPAPGASRFD